MCHVLVRYIIINEADYGTRLKMEYVKIIKFLNSIFCDEFID